MKSERMGRLIRRFELHGSGTAGWAELECIHGTRVTTPAWADLTDDDETPARVRFRLPDEPWCDECRDGWKGL